MIAKIIAARYPNWPSVHVFVYAGLGDKEHTFEAVYLAPNFRALAAT